MPEPHAGEDQDAYVSRYVGSAEAKASFPDIKQRLAVAYSKWRKHRGLGEKVKHIKDTAGK